MAEATAETGSEGQPAPAKPADTDITLTTGLQILWPFAEMAKGRFIAAAVLATLSSLALLGPFWLVYRSVEDIVLGHPPDAMYDYALLAALFVFLQYAFLAAAMWVSHHGAFATLAALRLRVGDRLKGVPLGFLTSRRSGEVQRTLNDDIERLEIFLAHAIPDLVSTFTTALFLIGWLLLVNLPMGLVGVAMVTAAAILMTQSSRRGSRKMASYLASLGRMNGSMVEFLRAMPVVRTFNGSRRVFGETEAAIADGAEYQAQWAREFVPLYTAYFVLLTSPVLVIVPAGLWFWHLGLLDTAVLLFFFIVGLGFTLPLLRVQQVMVRLSYLALGARLVKELDEAEILKVSSQPVSVADGRIDVQNVSFSYEAAGGTEALKNITFSAEPRQVTAIVGPSGSGKSTLARLIARFWDVDSGAIHLGGVDLRDFPPEQLMSQLAFVFQETFLFDDTIAANLRMARPEASDAELEGAARAANAHDFICALPGGYDTPVGEGGARLSGGERQRIAIARAILKDAPVVLLDEATAYVDPENEVALQAAIDELVAGKTVILIAHRLSTIAGADQILVLDEGRIVERGRHDALLEAQGLYAQLWAAFSEADATALSNREQP
ncbi:MAG: ABC transporter ATP-binding protein [Pseudomonadota bacterium]